MKEAIQPIFARPRHINGVPQTRKTFNCLVAGAQGSGKSTFLSSYIGSMAEEIKEDQSEVIRRTEKNGVRIVNRSAVKAIKEKDPKNKDKYAVKYLTLTEVNEEAVLRAKSKDQGPLFS